MDLLPLGKAAINCLYFKQTLFFKAWSALWMFFGLVNCACQEQVLKPGLPVKVCVLCAKLWSNCRKFALYMFRNLDAFTRVHAYFLKMCRLWPESELIYGSYSCCSAPWRENVQNVWILISPLLTTTTHLWKVAIIKGARTHLIISIIKLMVFWYH